MKQLETLILAFGALGVAMEARVPGELLADPALLVELLAFATPLGLGALAVFRGPRAWHAAVSAVAFFVAAARLAVWELLPDFMYLSSRGKLLVIAAIGGAVASALAVLTWRQTGRRAEALQSQRQTEEGPP